MSVDAGHPRAMRLLPFAAAARAELLILKHQVFVLVGLQAGSCASVSDHGERTAHVVCDLWLRSRRFSTVLGRSRRDVPEMCPIAVADRHLDP